MHYKRHDSVDQCFPCQNVIDLVGTFLQSSFLSVFLILVTVMTCHALPEHVKRIKQCHRDKNALIQAINIYKTNAKKTRLDQEERSAIAKQFNVLYWTLMNHIKNEQMQFISDSNTSKRKSLSAEKCTLVNFIVESADRGFPLNHNIKKYSNILLQARKGSEFKPVGH